MKKRICVAQVGYVPEGQLERIKDIICENRDADLIVFPELILHGHPSPQAPEGLLFRRMKLSYGSISRSLYEYIRSIGARVIFGELKKRGERFYNLATFVSPEAVTSYVKTHIHWTEEFVPGNKLNPVDHPSFTIGMTICFDAAFPEVWRVLALRGAQVIVNISAVPKDFPLAYMRRRLTGAALNNQVFVIYANRPGPYFLGHSGIFAPDGDCLVSASEEEAVLRAEIDLCVLEEWRRTERIYSHRRPELYRAISGKVSSARLRQVV